MVTFLKLFLFFCASFYIIITFLLYIFVEYLALH